MRVDLFRLTPFFMPEGSGAGLVAGGFLFRDGIGLKMRHFLFKFQ